MKRKGSARWQGDLKSGKGTISTESGALVALPYGFGSRFGEEKGTNPEELIGAAHASCFAMALSNELSKAGIADPVIETTATVELNKTDGAFTIAASHLDVAIEAKGSDKPVLEQAAATAKANCPVSRLLKAQITMNAIYST
jgi:osmotically inducible protein OsmC